MLNMFFLVYFNCDLGKWCDPELSLEQYMHMVLCLCLQQYMLAMLDCYIEQYMLAMFDCIYSGLLRAIYACRVRLGYSVQKLYA